MEETPLPTFIITKIVHPTRRTKAQETTVFTASGRCCPWQSDPSKSLENRGLRVS
jgi:hypothetical protein